MRPFRALLRLLPVRTWTAPLLGRAGERRAAWYYRIRGFRVVERNARVGEGEIDLILRRRRLWVFAEVKSRQGESSREPWEAVDRAKQLQVMKLADRWLRARKTEPLVVRFDVVSLRWNGWRFEMKVFEDAFRPLADPRAPWRWK
ncbi:MAG: YraN family protein [Thermoanaerobaculia bacterium]